MPDHVHPTDALMPLAQALGIAPESLPAPTLSLDDVRRFVTARVAELLDRRPEQLMSILYRVDVAEPLVKHAFAQAAPEALPHVLADLLIERQLQKIHLRKQYQDPAG